MTKRAKSNLAFQELGLSKPPTDDKTCHLRNCQPFHPYVAQGRRLYQARLSSQLVPLPQHADRISPRLSWGVIGSFTITSVSILGRSFGGPKVDPRVAG